MTFTRIALATLLGAATASALADPKDDTFQPDVFGTRDALHARTPGLEDPFNEACPLATPPIPMKLNQAVSIALCRNSTTRSAWAAAHQQAAALGSSESNWLPSIQASDAETRTHGPHVDATGDVVDTPQNSNDAALSLGWTLYDFGLRTGRIRSARHLLDAQAAATNSAVQQTVFAVVQAFYGVVAADAALVAAKSSEDAAQRSVDITQALQTGGAAALGDVLQARTAYDQAVMARIQAVQADKGAQGLLAVTLGLPADQSMKLLADPVPTDVPALTVRMSDLMSQAMRQRPDLAAAEAQRDSAIEDITVARAQGRPSVQIQAGRTRIDTQQIPLQNYSQIGVNVTWPIFTGFNVGYNVRQAQAALEAREVSADQARLTVSQDVWNGYYGMDAANQQLSATATLVKTAADNQEVSVGRYKAGVGTIVDLLTAQTAAANAAQARIAAERNWQVARAQLVLALGRLTNAQPLAGNALP
jgi:outer membrane protein